MIENTHDTHPAPDAGLAAEVGADRVLAPAHALPRDAERLDPAGPVRATEIEVDVTRLCLDSTSFQQLRDAAADGIGVAARIEAIVRERGKMHNPATDSGGVLVGRVAAVGPDVVDPPALGAEIVTLASLTLTPLRLDAVGPVGDTPQVPARGTAYVAGRATWAALPPDLPVAPVVDLFDVCAAANQVHDLVRPGQTVLVLGAGHAGQLGLAAARDAAGDARLVVADRDAEALARVTCAGLCDVAVRADLRDAVGAAGALRAAGVPPADVTVHVVSASGCETAALLATAAGGAILFFSMATSFAAAALTADGLAATARMIIGNGHAPDRGALALRLLRESPGLQAAFGVSAGTAGA